ncbi:MAG: hypothetical protein IT558_06675 [Alphaproteobacteria bacterium]|nr:hypothetical protein [Alphaproteobacteria bacterium]
MATDKQIRANQQNAKKSTGPTTPDGKRKSSRNALTHGFTAETHTMDCESADDYQTLLDEYTNLYQPDAEPHNELVRQLAHAQWNLRRTRVMEKGILDDLYSDVLEYEEDEDNDEITGSENDEARHLGNCFRNGSKLLVRYTRYAAHFAAQWWRAYRALEKLKNAKPTKQKEELGSFPQSEPPEPAPPPGPSAPKPPRPTPKTRKPCVSGVPRTHAPATIAAGEQHVRGARQRGSEAGRR